jgi:guanylate kinase
MAGPLRTGKLVLLIGPSGVGKSAVLRCLRESHAELHFPKSATTRERRKGETQDTYHFVSEHEFDALLEQHKFLEWATVHGVARYGTLVDEIIPAIEQGKTVVREVDVQGFDSIRDHELFAGTSPRYSLVSIFILPENTEQLIARITNRAPISKEELAHRMASMEDELKHAELCTHTVLNREGKLEETYREVEKLILS